MQGDKEMLSFEEENTREAGLWINNDEGLYKCALQCHSSEDLNDLFKMYAPQQAKDSVAVRYVNWDTLFRELQEE